MTNPPQALVGLAIIAKDEEESLPQLLASIDSAFDRVVLVDTGSSDRTVQVFTDWAYDQTFTNGDFTYEVAFFEWCNDFSAARNFADEVLMREPVEWKSWADCDDIIVGSENIRQLVTNAPAEASTLFCHYDYISDPVTGQCVCALPRERFVRSSAGMEWQGRVHEAQEVKGGGAQFVPEGVVYWKHMIVPGEGADSNLRNIAILEQWNEDEPNTPRIVGYLGTEYSGAGRVEEAIYHFRQYLQLDVEWAEEKAQIQRKLAKLYIASGEFEAARLLGLEQVATLPRWTDGYLTLAESSLALEKNEDAIHWAEFALSLGAPQNSMLIINPIEYEYMPNKVMAGAYSNMGQFDKAIEYANRVLNVVRDDMVIGMVQQWTNLRKKDNTANTFVTMAQQLVNHDEQAKALTLLEECVPWFAKDHPKVIACLSELRTRTAWVNAPVDYADHYENGGSKPEDFIPDGQIDALCEALPRTGFLLANVSEQINDKINKEITHA